MAGWHEGDLSKIDSVDELRISTGRADGSLRKPVIIWSVQVDGNLYIRAVEGVEGLWYTHAMEQGEGQISAGGVEQETMFTPERDTAINDRIDAEYQREYDRYAKNIVDSTLTNRAREATLRVDPK